MGDEQISPALTGLIIENQQADPMTEARHTQRPIPRFEPINREQMVMRVVDVEQLVEQDHPVRAIWEFVGRLDLSSFCEQIRAVEGERGRPTHHPRLMHDGTKIKACASKGTFRGEKRVEEHLEIARRHVEEMKAQSDEDMKGRVAKARRRATREKQQRLESAVEEFKKIRASQAEARKKKEEIRVSEIEPEARIMKYKDGGYAPSYNAQVSADRLCGVIVGVGLSQSPT